MHKHVEWDDPGADSVMRHYERNPQGYSEPGPGDILTARFQGLVARVRVEAYVDGTSIGPVVALIEPRSGKRLQTRGKLVVGDTVRLPDASRAFEPRPSDNAAEDEEPQ
ncbi:MAG: hypothetical protein LPK08_05280 [Halomonas sp.]|uniref:Uncharacterized protein n=1 Tax=Halomonas sulfidivorans TaxID=2733488 RepID=A0ABX7WB54_9GAMM|nr:hypothetical protein [Halomonas sulfidivorans]MDX5376920.1 hypothetical protein [Halomonas sp.]QTP57535.1 hypothetical protein HNO53_01610 [Halomonas sulfidivorans]